MGDSKETDAARNPYAGGIQASETPQYFPGIHRESRSFGLEAIALGLPVLTLAAVLFLWCLQLLLSFQQAREFYVPWFWGGLAATLIPLAGGAASISLLRSEFPNGVLIVAGLFLNVLALAVLAVLIIVSAL